MKVVSGLGWALLLVLPIVALYMVFMVAPNEATMGEVQRIFYFHVSSAMVAFLSFFVAMVASIVFLVRHDPMWDRAALASVEVGVMFLLIVLVTGPMWAKPVWGVYWVWQDARLITTLVLWVYFCVYLVLRSNWGSDPQSMRFAAVLAIVGFVDVPIVYYSVKWWNFIHPSHVVGPMGGGMDPVMAKTFGVSVFAILTIWVALIAQRMRLESTRAKFRTVSRALANQGVRT